jgi:hypothetical protein
MSFLCCFSVIKDCSFLVIARRIARVFLYRKSRGRSVVGPPCQDANLRRKGWSDIHLEFLALYISRTFCLCFWLMTVKTRAMDFRVVLLERWTGQSNHSTHTTGIGFGFGCNCPPSSFSHSFNIFHSSLPAFLRFPSSSSIPLLDLLVLPSPNHSHY